MGMARGVVAAGGGGICYSFGCAEDQSARQGSIMVVTLSPELAAIVQSKVDSGRFSDAEAVMREALDLLEEQEKLGQLRAALAIGEEQSERGEVVEYTPELRAGVLRQVREMAADGRKPKADVLP
jgi:antitoxin ParD1/3/4